MTTPPRSSHSPTASTDAPPTAARGPLTLAVGAMTRHTSPSMWRVLFAGYAIALTIGTHLPTFRPPGQAFIPTDKILHLIAFAGFAGLLMLTRWLAPRDLPEAAAGHAGVSATRARQAFDRVNIMRCGVVAIGWAMLDELSQGLPMLENRHVTWQDALANTLGVLAAVAVAWFVFRPIEGRLQATGSDRPS